jgi:hypothetical protein
MNNLIFKLYIKKLWCRVSLDTFNQLNKAFKNWKAKGRKGEKPIFNIN